MIFLLENAPAEIQKEVATRKKQTIDEGSPQRERRFHSSNRQCEKIISKKECANQSGNHDQTHRIHLKKMERDKGKDKH